MLLTGNQLFTGSSDVVIDDHVVEIDGARIVAIRPRASLSPDTDVIDLGDVTILPGLIDVHQHLCFDASTDPVAQLAADDDATLLLRMRLAAQRALSVGITTIRDLGDRNYLSLTLRDWFASGDERGPRIVASGPPITTRNGHCWFLGGEIDHGPASVRAAVRERVEHGVDVIKVMASGGNMTPTVGPHESQFGIEALTVALEEAHAAGLPLAVHAHGGQAIRDALAVGADSIEHCTFFTAEGVEADADVLQRLASSDCVISMTAAVVPGTTAMYPAIQQRVQAITANHRALYDSGAQIVCSSDAGVGPNKPHTALPHGVATFLPAIGMSNSEALRNITEFAAQVCGIANTTGTIEPGKDADLLVVAGDPLTDLTALHNVVAVIARGHPTAPRSVPWHNSGRMGSCAS